MADKFIVTPKLGMVQHLRNLIVGFAERVVAGLTVTPSATFARPNDVNAYAIGDMVANDTVAGNVVPLSIAVGASGRSLHMLRARVAKTDAGVANAAFRVHVFATAPAVVAGDNAAFASDNAANYLGAFDVASMTAFSDGAVGFGVPLVGTSIAADLATDDVSLLIEARGAYVPVANEQFTVTIEAVED